MGVINELEELEDIDALADVVGGLVDAHVDGAAAFTPIQT